MTTQTTTFDQVIAKRLGSAFLSGLREGAALLIVEAKKHEQILGLMEDGGEEGSEEALLHSIEAESLRAMADKIMQLPNPYYGAVAMGESND